MKASPYLVTAAAFILATQAGECGVPFPSAVPKTRASAYPYSMVGKLTYQRGSQWYTASGTIVKPRSVLTAAHALYDPSTGFARNVDFDRIQMAVDVPAQTATKVYVLGGYQSASAMGRTSDGAFATDVGGCVFPNALADGHKVKINSNPMVLALNNYSKVSAGFAAEAPNNGQKLTFVSAESAYYVRKGAFYLNNSLYYSGGMSGGGTFINSGNNALLSGVVVAGSKSPLMGGVRAIDRTVTGFMAIYLP